MHPLVPDQVLKLITHANCADGLTAAIVARELCGPDLPVEFVAYGTEQHRQLTPEPGVVFADFCPHRDSVEAWLPFDPVVLDHHHHAQEIVRRFPRGLFDNERCGALLLLYNLFARPSHDLMRLAVLADVRDRWVKESQWWDDAQAQARVLMALHRDVALKLGATELRRFSEFGKHLATTERLRAEEVVNTLRAVDVFGCTLGVVASGSALSSMIGDVARDRGFDLTACFFLTEDPASGRRMIVYSLRSGERVDCGAFAKWMGGGGHQRAAGFDVDFRAVTHSDPWTFVQIKFQEWLVLLWGGAQ
jgi:oligoribonuclease NrnB/cAMP/cGMP phosphodiesterase (DHH superfamily)